MSAVAGAGRGEFWSGVGHGGVDGAVVAHCAIGDVHGDRDALRDCLRAAAARDDAATWIAEPRTLLLSCGDVLDFGEDDWTCLQMLRRLQDDARAKRGDVAMVLGNHEVMNVVGDVKDVHPRALEALATERDLVEARRHAFEPGGRGARVIADLCGATPVVKIVGDTLFCHGGLRLPALDVDGFRGDAPTKLAALNGKARQWLLGASATIPAALQASALSPVWSRAYSKPAGAEPPRSSCDAARETLAALKCSRMVVGHTPQITQGVNAACCGAVYRIDTGASAHFGGRKETLELRPGQEPRILSPHVRFDFV
mmetsp:Transcript_20788/g.64218  ORF Transcript_20788/g.64218 Transcript_20788/m.64218 type:complete len:313 (-) Transcript_20788:102-1040(-)